MLSQQILRDAKAGKLGPVGSEIGDATTVWDVVALFDPGVQWPEDSFPIPSYNGSPVVDAIDEVRRRLVR